MSGGWGTPRKPVLDSIREVSDDVRKRYREGTGLPPSNDPERPPKGPASGTLANPQRTQVDVTINITGPVQHCPADCPCHIEENHD